MRTLIVSDLHLGASSRVDLLRRPELRATLLEQLEQVDRLVLLGDVLELRHGPHREALAAAKPVFEDLGRAMAGRELVISAGNHDHALVEPWLAARAELQAPAPLGTEQRLPARDASPMLAALAAWAAPADVSVAYPGLWVRPDVYATHGHYLDCHFTMPTIERLGIAAMSRVLRRPPAGFTRAEDYEAVTAPLFAWIDAVAQHQQATGTFKGATTVRAWHALNGGGRDSLRTRALAAGFPLAVAALNRAGFGPLRARVSTTELRQAGLRAMGEVVARLGLGDAYVIFGHTHRRGPLPGDDPREWVTPGGGQLVNCGSWNYDGFFLTPRPGESPYWPGSCVLVEDEGPPVLRRLLDDSSHAELRPQ